MQKSYPNHFIKLFLLSFSSLSFGLNATYTIEPLNLDNPDDLEQLRKIDQEEFEIYNLLIDPTFGHTAIIKVNNKMVGYINYYYIDSTEKKCEIGFLAIGKCYRRCGYATQLLEYVLQIAKEEECHEIIVLPVSYESRNLYHTFGFILCIETGKMLYCLKSQTFIQTLKNVGLVAMTSAYLFIDGHTQSPLFGHTTNHRRS